MLTSLTDRSLLESARMGNPGARPCYRLHELIKQYSRAKLSEDPVEAEHAADRHRRHYMDFLQARNGEVMGGHGARQAVKEVREELENVRAALNATIVEGHIEELAGSLNILLYFWEIEGLFEEAEQAFGRINRRMEELLAATPSVACEAGRLLGRAFMYQGWHCMRLGRYAEALTLTRNGMTLSLEAGELEGYGLGLNSLGVIALAQGQYEQARESLLDALKIYPRRATPGRIRAR